MGKKNVFLIISLVFNTFFIFFFTYQLKNPNKLNLEDDGMKPAIVISGEQPEVIGAQSELDEGIFKVSKVIDGDTVELDDGQVVRYIGIDTPETVDPREAVQCYGKEASSENKKLIEGKEVRLVKDVSNTDKYGRLLRYVWVKSEKEGDEIFINDYLVRNGFASAITYPPDIKYQDLFKEAQNEAIKNNRGLWSSCITPTILRTSGGQPLPSISLNTGSRANVNCSSNTYNCSDFKTQSDAQNVFDTCGGSSNDIHKLDRDGDGKVCETLP